LFEMKWPSTDCNSTVVTSPETTYDFKQEILL